MSDEESPQTQPARLKPAKLTPKTTDRRQTARLESELAATQAIGTRPLTVNQPASANGSPPVSTRRRFAFGCLLVMLLAGLYASSSLTGALAGYQSAAQALHASETHQAVYDLTEQFLQGQQDFAAGRYELARQRFEYILAIAPDFPGVTDELADVLLILYATATPTPVPATATASPTPTMTASPTLTPTRDLRPVQDMLASAQSAYEQGDWSKTIEIIAALRNNDPVFEVTRLDGMLFMALRNRGVERILRGKDLEGGSYDLSLAERFGPLDAEAGRARELARLYMYGSAFWEAYPSQAVFYFSQVAAAAPYLTDASGWTARERYRAVLIQYGNALANDEKWCQAEDQYRLAAAIYSDGNLDDVIDQAALECSPPTKTATLTPRPTETATPTASGTATVQPPSQTPTPPAPASATVTPPVDTLIPPTATATSGETVAPASETPTLAVETPTPSPTVEQPTPTETGAPTAVPPSETATHESPPSETPTDTPTEAAPETPAETPTP